MRAELRRIGLVAVGLVATSTACNHFDRRTLEYTVVLPRTVLQLDYDDSLINPYLGLDDEARLPFDGSFCFVDSPEMLDSFGVGDSTILYQYFPEDGSLLILWFSTCEEDEFLGYSAEFSGDTVTVWVEINEWDGVGSCVPGFDSYFLPFGVVLQPATEPEP